MVSTVPTPVLSDAALLHPGAGLRLDISACAPRRVRAGNCTRCADSCPADVIRFDATGPVVSDDCVGCGRCVVACDMGALSLERIPDVDALPAGLEAVECSRVPLVERMREAAEVPCFGALDAAWLIAAHQRYGDGPVLLDRGHCAGCPSAAVAGPAQEAALEYARDLLESMGVAPSRLPRVCMVELPSSSIAAVRAPAVSLSRRAFFGRIGLVAGRQANARLTATQAAEVRPPVGVPTRPSLARLRLLSTLAGLASERNLPMPFGVFRSARVDSTCCDRGLCAAVCPTTALVREQDGHQLRITFSALACIDCGACVTACPEAAIRLDECMDEGWRETDTLRKVDSRECVRCGQFFIGGDELAECPTCAKSTELARDVFRLRFPAPASAMADVNHPEPLTKGRTVVLKGGAFDETA